MPEATVLIISNTDEIISGVQVALVSTVYSISVARDANSAESFFAASKPEIVLVELDIKQSGDGPFYARINEYSPSSEIILLCNVGDIKLASELVNQNAVYDYFVVNPCYDGYRLPIMIRRALERRELTTKFGPLDPALGRAKEDLNPPLDAMKKSFAPVEKVEDSTLDPTAVAAMGPELADSVSEAVATPPSASKKKKKEKSVLVIEDNEATMDLIEDILTCMDYEIFKANTAIKGIEIARERLPDLILLDIMLPGMNGIEALQRLRKNLLTAEIPVIVMTSLSGRAIVDQCMKGQCDDYIVKPFSKEILEDRVRKQIARARKGPTRL